MFWNGNVCYKFEGPDGRAVLLQRGKVYTRPQLWKIETNDNGDLILTYLVDE